MDPGQILWKAYLSRHISRRFFFLFSKFSLFKFLRSFFVSFTWEAKFQNTTGTPTIKNLVALRNFLMQDNIRLEISKYYSSYSFQQCHSNFMRTLATIREYRLLLFLAIGHVLKILCRFEIIKCAISLKLLAIERNGWTFGTCGPRYSICGFWVTRSY